MDYKEFLPDICLAKYIECFWTMSSQAVIGPKQNQFASCRTDVLTSFLILLTQSNMSWNHGASVTGHHDRQCWYARNSLQTWRQSAIFALYRPRLHRQARGLRLFLGKGRERTIWPGHWCLGVNQRIAHIGKYLRQELNSNFDLCPTFNILLQKFRSLRERSPWKI